MLTDRLVMRTLERYGIAVDEKLADSVRRYIALLLRWNERISLTSITDPTEILKLHFGESLYALAAHGIRSGRLADVGSGAGFPGMAIALADRSVRAVLIESNMKKSVFLSEVKRELELENVEIVRDRMESLDVGAFNFVTSRAVGQFGGLLKFAKDRFAPGGRVILWIGQQEAERLATQTNGWSWSKPILIPDSQRRYILAGSFIEGG